MFLLELSGASVVSVLKIQEFVTRTWICDAVTDLASVIFQSSERLWINTMQS
jgi:hypothetical protein